MIYILQINYIYKKIKVKIMENGKFKTVKFEEWLKLPEEEQDKLAGYTPQEPEVDAIADGNDDEIQTDVVEVGADETEGDETEGLDLGVGGDDGIEDLDADGDIGGGMDVDFESSLGGSEGETEEAGDDSSELDLGLGGGETEGTEIESTEETEERKEEDSDEKEEEEESENKEDKE